MPDFIHSSQPLKLHPRISFFSRFAAIERSEAELVNIPLLFPDEIGEVRPDSVGYIAGGHVALHLFPVVANDI